MTAAEIAVYVLAVAFALLWLGTVVFQYKKVQRKGVELLKGAASKGLSFGEGLVGLALGLLGLVLFLGALWFTIAPFFYPRIMKPLSGIHIAGAAVDWAAFLFVDALLKNLKDVSESIRLILSGDPPGRFAMRGTEGVRPEAPQLNSRQPRDTTHYDAAGAEDEEAPSSIQRQIPEAWFR